MTTLNVSIIIVHYKVKQELFDCLTSIKQSRPKVSYEIIVVDNDENKTIGSDLQNKFPKVKYIKSQGNLGFGGGNNLGAKAAVSEFLFFLNPDTLLFPNTIDILIQFMEKDEKIAIAAPLLLDHTHKPYPLQGATTLTPLEGIFALSFINKYFPFNPISKKFMLRDWDKTTIKQVDAVPGTAFIIRRNIFEKIGGFDEHFFLYFEENDLCKRVKDQGYKIFINPKATVMHAWGRSTQKSNRDINKIFKHSRFYYFQKHYGLFWAYVVQGVADFGKEEFLFLFILALATLFLLYYIF